MQSENFHQRQSLGKTFERKINKRKNDGSLDEGERQSNRVEKLKLNYETFGKSSLLYDDSVFNIGQ